MIKLCEPIKSMQRSHARGDGRRLATERDKPHTGIHTAAHTLCHTHTHNTRAALAAVAVSCNNCSICSQRVSDRRPKTIPAVATRLLRATHTNTQSATRTHTHTLEAAACVCRLRCQCNAARTPSNCIWLGVLNLKTISHKFNFYFNEQYVPVAAPRCMQHAKSQENTEQASNNRANRATNQLSTN